MKVIFENHVLDWPQAGIMCLERIAQEAHNRLPEGLPQGVLAIYNGCPVKEIPSDWRRCYSLDARVVEFYRPGTVPKTLNDVEGLRCSKHRSIDEDWS